MAFKIKVKRNSSAPATGALDAGEFGYNTSTTIPYIGNGTGNAATEIISNSSTAQTKVGAFTTQGKLGGEFLELEILTGTSPTVGQLTYDTDAGTFRAGLFGNYVLELGEKSVYFIENVTGSTIPKGSIVGFAGASGDHLRGAPFLADSSANPNYIMGIADQSIANNAFGFVVHFGKIRGIDTSAYAPGTILYASASSAGALTSTEPTSPNLKLPVGAVVKQNASSGIIQIRMKTGERLGNIHDVAISSPANGHVLIYDNAQARWENNTITAGSPISITNGAGTITIGLASAYGDTQNPYASKTQKTFLAAPNAADGAPSFRTIVASDIPTLNQNTTGTSAGVVATVAGTSSAELVRGNMADNDQFRIMVGATASNAGFAEIATADDGTEPIHVRQYTGVFTTLTRTATLLDGSGNTSFPGTITGTRLISTIATGTAPLSVTSTTAVTNLNADLLDGNHSSAFAASVHTHDDRYFTETEVNNKTFLKSNTDNRAVATIPNDYNALFDIKGLKQNSTIGITGGSTYSALLGIRGWADSSGGDSHELAFDGGGGIYHRHGSTTTWNAWAKLWSSGNDGTGSTLDADLLDGEHGSFYAADSTVVKLTGDQTIAGNKTFSNNVTITGDLLINGATTNINTTNLVVEDKNIILGDVATPNDTTADGGGITLKGATDKTITWVDSTDSWTFNQTIRHEGLNPSTGTNVDQTKSTTFASALTTGWTDVTGVSGTYLATGSYIVQIISNGEYYTGNMSWFSGSTTTTTVDEIELHRAGAAASAARIYARVARVSGGTLKLQVSASTSLSSHTMTFTFRRTI
jgi:uncharacterized protein (DUF736 family)